MRDQGFSYRQEERVAPVVVIGAGPGIGTAVARRFARQGLPVVLIARRASTVAAAERTLGSGVPVLGLTADSADETALRGVLDEAAGRLGVPEAVVYNAAIIQRDSPGEIPAEAHQRVWAVNVGGALTAAAHMLPLMTRRGGGSFIVTGGMPEPDPRYTSLSLTKAAVRAMVPLLGKQYGPGGIHVATVTVAGPVAPGTAFDPDDIAEHYWRLHTQPRDHWDHEVVHG
jgi:NAD(P)-dependent dehydrogenase (short-subunit alcohol dehydrogenase family)